jgi:D-glycero-D-manno-heptose 1,7-bisphosphate phosphatase
MLLQARDELDIDLAASWIVGDNHTDLEAGWAAGTRAALVKTGFGEGTLENESSRWPRQPDLVGNDVYRVLCDIFWGSVS